MRLIISKKINAMLECTVFTPKIQHERVCTDVNVRNSFRCFILMKVPDIHFRFYCKSDAFVMTAIITIDHTFMLMYHKLISHAAIVCYVIGV